MRLTSTHWGVYEVEASGGRVSALKPFAPDPDPSPIGASMPAAIHGGARVRRPAVRRSVLEGGPGAKPERRGIDATALQAQGQRFG